MKDRNFDWNLIDYDIEDKLPKEDCEIWITRTCYDGSRWVQKVDFYVDDEEIIMWDSLYRWFLYLYTILRTKWITLQI